MSTVEGGAAGAVVRVVRVADTAVWILSAAAAVASFPLRSLLK